MRRMKHTEWHKAFFNDTGGPCSNWVINQIKAGEIPGEQIGGLWFVHVKDGTFELDYGTGPASNDAETVAEALIEDWVHGPKTA
ncbi:hypothetical protein ACEK07_21265 [Alcanivoracaceae bacterium MT1]